MTDATAAPSSAPAGGTVDARPRSAVAAGVLAGLLHLGIGVFPLSASGLLAPLWAIVVIYLGWLVAAGLLWRIWQRHPLISLLVPPTTLALWAGWITVGDVLLGWTA
jgi:hypothetical protein